MRMPLRSALAALLLAGLAALTVLPGCAPSVRVDEGSPMCLKATVDAGSDLTEASQYVEVRLPFDTALESSGAVIEDLDVRLNGEVPDSKTIAVSAEVDGTDVVVRLEPTQAASNGGSVYFALYDGQLRVAAKRADGALPHVTASSGGSTAVLDGAHALTVPTGMQVEGVSREGRSVTFEVERPAQVRCCAWFSFGDGLPLVKLHNHAFYRDTPAVEAERLAATVNANYGDAYAARADGAAVTVTAKGSGGGALVAKLVEGPDVDLSADASIGQGGMEVS